VDSAWWHGHPSRWTKGRHPPEWDRKIERNIERDADVNALLEELGWAVVRVWDFELVENLDGALRRVEVALTGN
jgi:DNA mismatch endonuclease, patch repair protein